MRRRDDAVSVEVASSRRSGGDGTRARMGGVEGVGEGGLRVLGVGVEEWAELVIWHKREAEEGGCLADVPRREYVRSRRSHGGLLSNSIGGGVVARLYDELSIGASKTSTGTDMEFCRLRLGCGES